MVMRSPPRKSVKQRSIGGPGQNSARQAEKVHIPASHLCTYVHEPWPNFKSPVFQRIFAVFGIGRGWTEGKPRPPNPDVPAGNTVPKALNCSDHRRAAGFERY